RRKLRRSDTGGSRADSGARRRRRASRWSSRATLRAQSQPRRRVFSTLARRPAPRGARSLDDNSGAAAARVAGGSELPVLQRDRGSAAEEEVPVAPGSHVPAHPFQPLQLGGIVPALAVKDAVRVEVDARAG